MLDLIDNLQKKIQQLETALNKLDVLMSNIECTNKEWGAIHCHGMITGYKLLLQELEQKLESRFNDNAIKDYADYLEDTLK